MAETVSFSSDNVGAHTQILTLEGGCGQATALDAEQLIGAALDAGRTEIVFDLRGVSSIEAPVLQVLMRGLIQAKGRQGSVVLIRPNPYVWATFESSGLDLAFRSFSDLKGAFPGDPIGEVSVTP
jgi:anti-anti-sigma factor